MNILVTGGAGFIGSHIVDAYLNLGHRVIILDNLSSGKKENISSGAIFHEMDLLDPRVEKLIKDEHIEIINHHAAQIDVRVSVADPRLDASINTDGWLNVLESARMAGVGRKTLDGGDGAALDGAHIHHARAHRVTVHMHGARAALGNAATEFRTG